MSCTVEGADRRLKEVLVTFGVMQDVFKTDGSALFRFEGLPRTAELVRIEENNGTRLLSLIFRHASFDVVKIGDQIPILRLDSASVLPCEGCLAQWDRMDHERREGKSTIATTQAC